MKRKKKVTAKEKKENMITIVVGIVATRTLAVAIWWWCSTVRGCITVKYKKAKIEVGFFISNAAPTQYDRNPVRHATVKMPLQSESSLKYHLQLLRAARGFQHRRFPIRVGGHRDVRTGRRTGSKRIKSTSDMEQQEIRIARAAFHFDHNSQLGFVSLHQLI